MTPIERYIRNLIKIGKQLAIASIAVSIAIKKAPFQLRITEDWEEIFAPKLQITEDWEEVFSAQLQITEDWEKTIIVSLRITEDWES